MTSEEAIWLMIERFPLTGYTASAIDSYRNIAKTALRHLQPGGKILDFGCGPADKTAILQFLGFQCSGYDDLQDCWHKIPQHREKIISFAKECGVDLRIANGGPLPFPKQSFDMLMLHDVLEHLHDSPCNLLIDLLELVKTEGFLFITVPNAANIRKRIEVLFGGTNLQRFEYYYWYPGTWRGHIREYVRRDLVKLAQFLDLQVIEICGCDHMLHRLPRVLRWPYFALTGCFRGLKDSWMLVAKKNANWAPRRSLPPAELARILGTCLISEQPGLVVDKGSSEVRCSLG